MKMYCVHCSLDPFSAAFYQRCTRHLKKAPRPFEDDILDSPFKVWPTYWLQFDNQYSWQKQWCTDNLVCLAAASKCPRALLVLFVPIRPLTGESSSQDTASKTWTHDLLYFEFVTAWKRLKHRQPVMESCSHALRFTLYLHRNHMRIALSFTIFISIPASWTALEKEQLRTLHRTSWKNIEEKKLKATKGHAQIETACAMNQKGLVWSTDDFTSMTSMLTLFSRSFMVIHVGCDFCGSCEVRVARPLAKSCVSGGPSWGFLGNARPGPVNVQQCVIFFLWF